MRRLVTQACLITKHEISAQIAINGARLYATAGFHTRFFGGGGGGKKFVERTNSTCMGMHEIR